MKNKQKECINHRRTPTRGLQLLYRKECCRGYSAEVMFRSLSSVAHPLTLLSKQVLHLCLRTSGFSLFAWPLSSLLVLSPISLPTAVETHIFKLQPSNQFFFSSLHSKLIVFETQRQSRSSFESLLLCLFPSLCNKQESIVLKCALGSKKNSRKQTLVKSKYILYHMCFIHVDHSLMTIQNHRRC